MFKYILSILLILLSYDLNTTSVTQDNLCNDIIYQSNTKHLVQVRKTDKSNIILLAKLINSESSGESELGKLIVGSVVINRIKHSNWPNDIKSVIYQKNQFNGIKSPGFGLTDESFNVAKYIILNGSIDTDVYYFNSINSYNINTNLLLIEGNHKFFGLSKIRA